MNCLPVPTELLDLILAQCTGKGHRDVMTLFNACLVSRRWYQVARPHLYHSIQLIIRSTQLRPLERTFKANQELAAGVKELSIEFASYDISRTTRSEERASAHWIILLRSFLPHVIPSLSNLTVLKTDRRIGTTGLLAALLFKDGSGGFMNVPTDLSNLRSLELFAADCVYKYNYILCLPRLEHVCLNSTKVVDIDGEDRSLPFDWGWASESITELVLRLESRTCHTGNLRTATLMSNSLSGLSRSLPKLKTLQIEHFETQMSPAQCRALAGFFAPQISSSVRHLVLRDGRFDAMPPRLWTGNSQEDDKGVLASIGSSNVEHLVVDFSTLLDTVCHINATEAIDRTSIPLSVRQVTIRFADMHDGNETDAFLTWDWKVVVKHIRIKFPFLEEIRLELRLLEDANQSILKSYQAEFNSTGITLHIREHSRSLPANSSVTYSR